MCIITFFLEMSSLFNEAIQYKICQRPRQAIKNALTNSQLSIKFITYYYMADPLHLYYKPDLASNLLHIEDSQQISVKYNLLV